MTCSTDPNLSDFHHRIARIEAAHARGDAFEARGTLRAVRVPPPPRGRFVAPLLVLGLLLVVLAGLVLAQAFLWQLAPGQDLHDAATVEAGRLTRALGHALGAWLGH